MFKRERRSAMITIELAISLVLVTVVLFITLGVFSDNLKDMFTASNFKNIFNGESVRTFFAQFNRDYSNSQVDVQLLGQQGLQIIRQKANNSEVSLIGNAVSASSSGGAVSRTNATSMIYLTQVINIIVGNADICEKMPKESVKFCGQGIPDAQYSLTANGSKLTVLDKKNGKLTNLVTRDGFIIQNASSDALQLSDAQKVQAIKALTDAYGSSVNSSDALDVARSVDYYSTQITAALNRKDGASIESNIDHLLEQVLQAAKDNNKNCTDFFGNTKTDNSCNSSIKQYMLQNLQAALIAYKSQLSSYVTNADDMIKNTSAQKTAVTGYLPDNMNNQYYIKKSGSWYNSANKKDVSDSENALLFTKSSSSKLKEFASNATITNSANAIVIDNAKSFYSEDGGGGTAVGGSGSSGVSNKTSSGGYSSNANSQVVYQEKIKCESDDDIECSGTNITTQVLTVGGNAESVTFDKSYILSPLSSDRLAKTSNIDTRVKVLGVYYNMVNTLWNGSDSVYAKNVEQYLKYDHTNNSCNILKNGLLQIAKNYGLLTLQQDIEQGINYCAQ